MSFIELPFGFPGRVFRSPMPFDPYDLHGEVYDRLCADQIAVMVLLASDEACRHKTAISGDLLSAVISIRYIFGFRKDNPNVFNSLIQSWLHF
jgi:hypothetical protein